MIVIFFVCVFGKVSNYCVLVGVMVVVCLFLLYVLNFKGGMFEVVSVFYVILVLVLFGEIG